MNIFLWYYTRQMMISLKLVTIWNFKNIRVNFSYAVTLKYVSLLCTLNESFTYVWFCNNHWSFGECWFAELHRSSKYWNISSYINTTFVSITNDLIRRVFKDSSFKIMVRDTTFPKFQFSFEVWIFVIGKYM